MMELRGRRYRHRIDFNEADHVLLMEAAQLFGLNRSEVMRRLLRGALQVGPAMSAENSQILARVAMYMRAVSIEIKRMQIVIKSDLIDNSEVYLAEDLKEAGAVWRAILEQHDILHEAMQKIVVEYRIRLTKASELLIPEWGTSPNPDSEVEEAESAR